MADTGDITLKFKGLKFIGLRPLGTLTEHVRLLAFKNPMQALALKIPTKAPQRLDVVPPDPWPGDTIRGRNIISGVLEFAGVRVDPKNASWNPAGASDDFLAELHSFDWLRDLRSVGGDKARRAARDAVANWIGANGKWHKLFWRPDVLGTRVASWICFHDFFCASADDEFRQSFYTSLIKQARHLHRVLPGNLKGLELIAGLKGLAYSGLAIEGGQERLESAFSLLIKTLDDQVLPDGVHVTRSPEAGVSLLKTLIDLRAALTAARLEVPGEIQFAIDKLSPAIRFFRHADCGLSVFNGGNEGQPNMIDAILTQSNARGKAMKSLPHGGYERLTQGRSLIIMDTGSVPVDADLTKHAHAGALGFEMSIGRDRLFVNCGSYPYAPAWREALRSTAAHSTLVIDSRNSVAIDTDGMIYTPANVSATRTEDQNESFIDASHDGYRAKYGITHRRCLYLGDNGEKLKGQDILEGGKSGIDFAVRLHLHPSVQVSLIRQGDEALIRTRSGLGYRLKVMNAEMKIEESVYWGEYQTPRRSNQIVLAGITGDTVRTHDFCAESARIVWELVREKI